jgi:U3 small nucleolar RNA-associated protein 21
MDTAQAYVWRLQNFVLGEHILAPCPENPTPVKVRTSSLLSFFLISNNYHFHRRYV